jgi:hypothetical protein
MTRCFAGTSGGPSVKRNQWSYISEMAAAAAAVTVFIAVYLVGFAQTGILFTLIFAWLPAAILAWLTARALRLAARWMRDLPEQVGRAMNEADGFEMVPLHGSGGRHKSKRPE